eukprot:GHRR01037207.1.p1 GENE.GHRR01037207.1~~GHRR01037207.1.p1  ORF type:complete len:109 (-),score=27.01 GHRR01037207.1:292-618(-)
MPARPCRADACWCVPALLPLKCMVQLRQLCLSLHSLILPRLCAQLDDPAELTSDDVGRIGARYGINMHKEQLEGLQKVYGQYLENIILENALASQASLVMPIIAASAT